MERGLSVAEEKREATAAIGEAPKPAAEEPKPERKPWWRRFRPNLAISAFAMSLTLPLINAYYAVRGANIVVLPPEQILLYRDGEGDKAVLSLAMQLNMINSASSNYGDVMLDASIQPKAGGPEFRYSSLVHPVFADTAATSGQCAFGSRCLSLPGLFMIELPDDLVSLPGGGAKQIFLSFPAASWNCVGKADQCAAYGTFDKALQAMGTHPLDTKLTIRFHSDGHRDIRCGGGPINTAYLAKVGWLAVPCQQVKVSGARII